MSLPLNQTQKKIRYRSQTWKRNSWAILPLQLHPVGCWVAGQTLVKHANECRPTICNQLKTNICETTYVKVTYNERQSTKPGSSVLRECREQIFILLWSKNRVETGPCAWPAHLWSSAHLGFGFTERSKEQCNPHSLLATKIDPIKSLGFFAVSESTAWLGRVLTKGGHSRPQRGCGVMQLICSYWGFFVCLFSKEKILQDSTAHCFLSSIFFCPLDLVLAGLWGGCLCVSVTWLLNLC